METLEKEVEINQSILRANKVSWSYIVCVVYMCTHVGAIKLQFIYSQLFM